MSMFGRRLAITTLVGTGTLIGSGCSRSARIEVDNRSSMTAFINVQPPYVSTMGWPSRLGDPVEVELGPGRTWEKRYSYIAAPNAPTSSLSHCFLLTIRLNGASTPPWSDRVCVHNNGGIIVLNESIITWVRDKPK